MELNKIYNEDCLDFMKSIDDNFFDLIITDPPYGINVAKNGFVGIQGATKPKDYNIQTWDKSIPTGAYFREIFRISKNQIIFGGNYMTDYLPQTSCWIVWDKKNDASVFADCELAWTSFDKAIRVFRYRWQGMIQERMNWKEKRFHPTQKPVALGRWIIDNFAKKGDVIFDPYAGSGTFLIAAKQKGLRFVGCELNEEYCKVIEQRLRFKTLIESVA